MNQEYKLSGNAGSIWFVGMLIGPILAILLSIVYAYIDVYNPLIYLTILVYLGYLFGIVLIQKLVIRVSKCRSKTSAYIYGALVGIFAIYANWSTFLYVLLQRFDEPIELTEILHNPAAVLSMASALSEDGWYEIFGTQVSGGVLWFIWVVEVIGILLAGIIGGSTVMHEEVFCEDCNRWAEDIDFDLRLSISDEAKATAAIKDDIAALTDLPLAKRGETPHLKVNLHHCSNCQNLSTADVDLITIKINDKGEAEEDSDDFSPVVLLTNEVFEKFKQKQQVGPAEDSPPPPPEATAEG